MTANSSPSAADRRGNDATTRAAAEAVLVGVDGAEKDMTAGTLAQNYQPCPPNCDPTSVFHL